MSKPNIFGNMATKGPKAPTSSAVVTKKSTESSNAKLQGTKMSLEGLEMGERTYIQSMVSQSNLVNDIFLEQRMKSFGTKDYRNSPLYKQFKQPTALANKLDIILRTMSGQMPSDFRFYNETDNVYEMKELPEVKLPDGTTKRAIPEERLSLDKVKLGKLSRQPFPSFNALLEPYIAGRYEYQVGKITGKPSYTGMPTMVNYFEMHPLSDEHAQIYINDPIGTLKTNKTKDWTLQNAIDLYQGPMKFNFNYNRSYTTEQIFESLRNVYKEALNAEESDTYKELPERLVPSKNADGRSLYIDDSCLKSGTIFNLATNLGTQAVLDFIVDAKCGDSYTIYYIKIGKLREILDTILGEGNWTVQTSSEVTWNGNVIVRGYYVDKLANFRYGQLVVPESLAKFGNTEVDKERSMRSKMERALITEVFSTLHGISEDEYKQLTRQKEETKEAAVGIAMERWRVINNKVDEATLIQLNEIKPIKRVADAQEEKFEKRYLEEAPKLIENKDKEDFKGIEKSKNGVTIEEKD